MSDQPDVYIKEALDAYAVKEKAGEINFLDILIVLAKRRKLIFAVTFGVAVLTSIIVLILPSRYTAETVVLPPSQNSSLSSSLLSQMGGGSSLAAVAGAGLGIKNSGDLYVSLFQTRTVEESVVKRFALMQRYKTKTMVDTRKALEHAAKVSLGSKDGLIRIDVTDKDPKFAADLANGYVGEYKRLSANLAVTEAAQRRLFFEEQLREANDNLTNAEEAMKSTEQKTGVLQMDSQARSLIESAALLRGQIAAKEVELQAMQSYATGDNPQVLIAQQQLAALKGQLEKLAGSDSNTSSDIIVPKGNIPQAQMEYLRRLRDLKYDETIEELIARQFELAKLDEAKQGAIVQVADVAVPPDKRSFPKRTLTVIVATFLGFFLICSWCFVLNAQERLNADPLNRFRLNELRAAFRIRKS
ncbi:GumC family protein [Acidicapsa dinghuensis]|uniref:GumC family protein n=1 Tax=Acidicapsa dinghuensis TaxID=2218256 RepID=A0ABW1EMV0_9BACT|nr:Wzz/FepE/Etk N-terminal domain-containing protein [Acidicapsa dinghuensis]